MSRPSARLLREVPASLYCFDALVDGAGIRSLPYRERRLRLEQLPLKGPHLACPPSWSDIDVDTVLAIATQGSFEGIIAKRSDSRYKPGRSTVWIKHPLRLRADVVIGGWIQSSVNEVAAPQWAPCWPELMMTKGHCSFSVQSAQASRTPTGADSHPVCRDYAVRHRLSARSPTTSLMPVGCTHRWWVPSSTGNSPDDCATPPGRASAPMLMRRRCLSGYCSEAQGRWRS